MPGMGLALRRYATELTMQTDAYPDQTTMVLPLDDTGWKDRSWNRYVGASVASATYTQGVSTSTKQTGLASLNGSTNNAYPATVYSAVDWTVPTGVRSLVVDCTKDFTIEGWINFASLPTADGYFITSDTPNSFTYNAAMNGIRVGFRSNYELVFYMDNGTDVGGPAVGATPKFTSAGVWYHWAVVRSGSNVRTYLDGVQSSGSTSVSANRSTSGNAYPYFRVGVDCQKQGASYYIDNIRVTNGIARYTAGFTPEKYSPYPLPRDPNWTKVVTLLRADNNTTDSSQSRVTWTGAASLAYGDGKFGSSGAFLTASSNRYVSAGSQSEFGFGTGDFTIEFWIQKSGSASTFALIDFRTATSDTRPYIYINSTEKLIYRTGTTDRITGATNTTSAWSHIALSRVSGTTRLYLNGALQGTAYADSNDYGSANTCVLGAVNADKSSPFDGYIEELRITKGLGRYSATTITVPASPFPGE